MKLLEAVQDAETMAQKNPKHVWHVIVWRGTDNFAVVTSNHLGIFEHPEAISYYNTKDKKLLDTKEARDEDYRKRLEAYEKAFQSHS